MPFAQGIENPGSSGSNKSDIVFSRREQSYITKRVNHTPYTRPAFWNITAHRGHRKWIFNKKEIKNMLVKILRLKFMLYRFVIIIINTIAGLIERE